jgi:hypothetical protein
MTSELGTMKAPQPRPQNRIGTRGRELSPIFGGGLIDQAATVAG